MDFIIQTHAILGLGIGVAEQSKGSNLSALMDLHRFESWQAKTIKFSIPFCLARDSTLTLVKPKPLRFAAWGNESLGKFYFL